MSDTFKVELRKDIKPFRYRKFGKIWRIPIDEITEKVYQNIKGKVKKIKVAEKVTEDGKK